jgi:LacI family transcriptional regulator
MPLTLEDIAKISGVSRSTVSRVVNHDRKVSPATREKVHKIIEEYNFYPNLAARGLASGHTNILGVIIPAGVPSLFTDPYFPILLQGISTACNKQDYSVMLSLSDADSEKSLVGRVIQNHLVDGVIIAFVIIGRQHNLEANEIDINNRQPARQATDFLIKQGYTRIATITGPLNQMAGLDRFDGYKDALLGAGKKVDLKLITEGSFTEAGGYAGMKKLLPSKPDAVFAASDMTAIGALRCLNEAGLRVPEDIALVGFDDIPASSTISPSLTTVRQPIHGMGEAAANLLIEIISSGSKEYHRVTMPTELVIRNSTARRNHSQN